MATSVGSEQPTDIDADAGSDASASTSAAPEPDPLPFATRLTERLRGKYKPVDIPSYEVMFQEDLLMNNCFTKSIVAGVMGGALGVAFGLFTASLDTGGIDGAPIDNSQPTRVVIRQTLQNMRAKSISYAKGFAFMGLIYSGVECVIEKQRARHDRWNATYAGCATGALLAISGGPQAMCFGCASFAVFSTAIEHFTGGM